ncbi:MAG: TonB-dependent receptor plug domain-containing protein [Bacteroidia bacterium]|nr:TonB-dependent receptor plug domain-containing protein [Bacteroidia bacterium]
MKAKKHILIFFLILQSITLLSQTELKGVIKDSVSSEGIVSAVLVYSKDKVVIADVNGVYSVKLPEGEYSFSVSFVGYQPMTKKIKVSGTSMELNFLLVLESAAKLDEVEVVADVAKNRETPVAFSNIDKLKIAEELGARDLPMLLNSTPGVYATETGGGAGDARVNVRGFDQRNVAVMIDGVPFNDMETGAVYWSNWNGLGSITRSMQVQRGLGASKLAVASVGGTINVLTNGIDSKRAGTVKQSIGNNFQTQTSLAYNSGTNKRGFGFTFSLLYGQGNGWIDQTWNKSFSYFVKVQKRYKNHLFSAGLNGASQIHAQRPGALSFGRPMYFYDGKFAAANGINTDSVYASSSYIKDKGIRFNYNWGYYVDSKGKRINVSENMNYYNKPVFSVSDFWTINDKTFFSNTAYLSVGRGGGATMQNIPTAVYEDGHQNYQNAYNANISTISPSFSSTEHLSTTYSRASVNNHFWYGLLSVLNYRPTQKTKLQVGFDGRSYNGYHWQTPYDLMGGDYILDSRDQTQPSGVGNAQFQMKRVGDKIGYNYTGLVRWAGLFAQAEHKTDKVSVFINATSNYTVYKRIDYFAKKDLVLSDTTIALAVGYLDTVRYNNTDYTINSPEAKTASTPWQKYFTYTIKTGLNYNINKNHNAFVNIGYLVLPPKYINVFDRNNRMFSDIKNQIVKAVEAGYGFKYKKIAGNVNAYYTIWQNKPPDFTPSVSKLDPTTGTNVTLYYNINGMDALHKGIEFDATWKPNKKIAIDGVVSLGDWKYLSSKQYTIIDQNGLPAIDPLTGSQYGIQSFDARGVHVGNAAQIQYVLGLKYIFIKHAYFKTRFTYFTKNYSSFDPTTLTGANSGRDSWKMPAYGLLDAFAGYDFQYSARIKYTVNLGVINALNTHYLTDAQNNATLYNGGFNAYSANVYFGQGTRWTLSLQMTF